MIMETKWIVRSTGSATLVMLGCCLGPPGDAATTEGALWCRHFEVIIMKGKLCCKQQVRAPH
jgi:hypothetical protein